MMSIGSDRNFNKNEYDMELIIVNNYTNILFKFM